MKSRVRVVVACAMSTLPFCACDKPQPSSSDATTAAASIAASAAPSSLPSASATSSTSSSVAANAGAASGAWNGSYKSVPGSLYYPTDAPNGKEWKDFKWQGDDAGIGLGEGALSITVDADGKTTGSGEGAIGAFTVNGTFENGQLSAKIDRKDSADRGLTGTAIAKLNADKLEGVMRLSLPEANVLRTATFSLAKK